MCVCVCVRVCVCVLACRFCEFVVVGCWFKKLFFCLFFVVVVVVFVCLFVFVCFLFGLKVLCSLFVFMSISDSTEPVHFTSYSFRFGLC